MRRLYRILSRWMTQSHWVLEVPSGSCVEMECEGQCLRDPSRGTQVVIQERAKVAQDKEGAMEIVSNKQNLNIIWGKSLPNFLRDWMKIRTSCEEGLQGILARAHGRMMLPSAEMEERLQIKTGFVGQVRSSEVDMWLDVSISGSTVKEEIRHVNQAWKEIWSGCIHLRIDDI